MSDDVAGEEEWDHSGCIHIGVQKEGEVATKKPYCLVAQESSLARLSNLQAVDGMIESATLRLDDHLDGLAEDEERPFEITYARRLLRDARELIETDAMAETVPRDDAIMAVVKTFQDYVIGDASDLLENARAAVDTLTTNGWVLIRMKGLA